MHSKQRFIVFFHSIPYAACMIFIIAIAVVSYTRLNLAIHRYFDPDEFMYTNWAYHIFRGLTPYRDFMMFVTPGFVSVLAPIYAFWHGTDPIRVARIIAWIISLFLAGSIGLLFWQIKRSMIALVPVLIFLILPMPSDKLMEIRPDNLAVLFFIIGLTFFYVWSSHRSQKYSPFLMGFFFGLSLLTLQKTALLIAVISFLFLFISLKEKREKVLMFSFLGFLFPIGAFILWALATGSPLVVLFSITTLAKENVYQTARFNTLRPIFFFSPNPAYYGEGGTSLGLVANYCLWILACVGTVSSLIQLILKKSLKTLLAGLPAILFAVACIQYLWISPLKFSQYLIPAAVFVAWFGGDWILTFLKWCQRGIMGKTGFALFMVLFLSVGMKAFFAVNIPKLNWTNDGAYQKIERILKRIPKDAYVLDLEGRTTYFPYPYYACCLAIGQFDSMLFHVHPSLRDSLRATKTRYIYQAELPRIDSLSPEDTAYIKAHYQPEEGGDLYVGSD